MQNAPFGDRNLKHFQGRDCLLSRPLPIKEMTPFLPQTTPWHLDTRAFGAQPVPHSKILDPPLALR